MQVPSLHASSDAAASTMVRWILVKLAVVSVFRRLRWLRRELLHDLALAWKKPDEAAELHLLAVCRHLRRTKRGSNGHSQRQRCVDCGVLMYYLPYPATQNAPEID